jgi:hypothetical protein
MDNATQLLNLGEEALSSEDVDKLHAPDLTGKAKDDLKLKENGISHIDSGKTPKDTETRAHKPVQAHVRPSVGI